MNSDSLTGFGFWSGKGDNSSCSTSCDGTTDVGPSSEEEEEDISDDDG